MVAIGSVVGALFGSGGGGEVQSALVKLAADAKYGVTDGDKVWNVVPGARTTRRRSPPSTTAQLPVRAGPGQPAGRRDARPGLGDPAAAGLRPDRLGRDGDGGEGGRPAGRQDPGRGEGARHLRQRCAARPTYPAKHGMSNALLVSGEHTDSGNPVAVFGPQTGYFAPQLLMLEELQGPGISARGAAFAGVSLYVELGRGQDYSWSATSAGQDITDTYALRLCEPNGQPATKNSASYLYHGVCTPMEKLERANSWKPTVADGTAAGSYSLSSFRTKYGIVHVAGHGRRRPSPTPACAPVSARGRLDHRVPGVQRPVRGARRGQLPEGRPGRRTTRSTGSTPTPAHRVLQLGQQPGARPRTPTRTCRSGPTSSTSGRAGTRTSNVASYTPPAQHPHSIDQDYYVSWNNKQAKDFSDGRLR